MIRIRQNSICGIPFVIVAYRIRSNILQCGGNIPLAFFLCRGCPFGLEKNILYTMWNWLINECSVGLYLILMVTYQLWQWNGSWNHLKFTFTEVRAHKYLQYRISFLVPKGFYSTFPSVMEWHYRYGKLFWKRHLLEHLFGIFTYINRNVATMIESFCLSLSSPVHNLFCCDTPTLGKAIISI